MSTSFKSRIILLTLLTLAAVMLSGCVYYNTMYHARRWFNQAESLRKESGRDLAAGQENKLYSDAIVKCSKILTEHPTSSWVDDALFMIGKSFYHLDENTRAERKFRELLSSFPDSKYASEARFYLGKARFKLENYQQARETFAEFMKEGKKKEWRADATFLMGEISAAEGDTARAVQYLNDYVANFSGSVRYLEALNKIGEYQFELGNYSAAAAAYARAAKNTDDPVKRYLARYEQGRCYYQLDSAAAGLAIFQELEEEQSDSVKLGEILLREAEGLKLLGEQREAILLYDAISTEFNQRPEAAEAFYELGVVCQDDFNDLELAKYYFDQASRIQRGGDFKTLSIERAAEITKVETFRSKLNSESAEEASLSRFLLAELYRTALNSPDSALAEYKDLVRTFPESGYAPKALLNIGYLYESYLEDTTSANQYYEQVLNDYPRSDEVSSALLLLGDQADEPTQLYPERLYEMAEEQHYDAANLDSASTLYKYFMKEFPESQLVPKADFAVAKIKLAQFVPSENPPTENPYRRADSLLAVEAARQDSIARHTADSLNAARIDSVTKAQPARDTVKGVDSDTIVTVTYKAGEKQIDSVDAGTDDIRLTDFIQGKGEEVPLPPADTVVANTKKGAVPPDDVPPPKRTPPAKPDSAGHRPKLAHRGDTTSTATDSVPHGSSKPVVAPDSLPPSPKDSKKISLDNFPKPQSDTAAGTEAEVKSKAQKTPPTDPVFGDTPADSAGAANDSLGAAGAVVDSSLVDSTEVVVVDSSMIWLFQHLANKYKGTDIGKEAERLASGQGVKRQQRRIQEPPRPQTPVAQADTATAAKDSIPDNLFAFQDTTGSAEAIEDALREEIDKWPLMEDEPIDIPEFQYPDQAATSKFQGRLTLKIKIDYNGRVTEVNILKGSNVALIDQEVKNIFLETYFDPLKIEPLHLGSYFIYYYEIELPEVYK